MSAKDYNSSTRDNSARQAPTLVICLRRPAPGIGKQRIAADIGPELAFELAEHLLAATLEDAEAWPGPVILSPANATDATWAGDLLARPAAVIPQANGNLGQRINDVDERIRATGHTRLIYIGSDAPVLSDADYAAATAALEIHDVVLGPAEDGGVTLMGAGHAWPELADLPWSSPALGRALALRCREQGLKVHGLNPRYDIDYAVDLPRLCADLATDTRPARSRLRGWLIRSKLGGPDAMAEPDRKTARL
jgi:glycosyltransferase A (GT-A) superfamily protein (DUF2064 family)